MYLFPFLTAGAHGLAIAFDRLNLTRTKFKPRALLLLTFLVMTVTAAAYVLIARPPFPALGPVVLGIVTAMVLLSFAQNIFELKGIQAMQLHTREPVTTLQPLLTGLLAYLLFPSEGNILYLAAIVVGVPIVLWSNAKRYSWRKLLTPGSGYVFADISLSAAVDNLAKLALQFLSPAYLGLFRIGGVFFLCCAFFRGSWKEVPPGGLWLGLVPGMFFGVSALARLFAFEYVGLNFTLLILLLEPGLVYLLSRVLLKEKLEWRPIIGSGLILCLIIAVRCLS
ncbi:MAG: EamA family transporter [bacterium]